MPWVTRSTSDSFTRRVTSMFKANGEITLTTAARWHAAASQLRLPIPVEERQPICKSRIFVNMNNNAVLHCPRTRVASTNFKMTDVHDCSDHAMSTGRI
jgi:hypothetical protein